MPAVALACATMALVRADAAAQLANQLTPQAAFDLEKADVEIFLDRTAYPGGGAARLAVVLTVDEGWHTQSHIPTYENLIGTVVGLDVPPGWPAPGEPTYPPGEMQTFGFAPDQPISVYDGEIVIVARLEVPAGVEDGTYPIRATVRYQACDDRMCLAPVDVERTTGLTVGQDGVGQHEDVFAAGAVMHGSGRSAGHVRPRGFVGFLLLAFLGGLILNAMPCVLPVLSLKVIALVRSAEGGRGAVAAGGVATAAGILASFLLLAGAAVIARSAGAAIGWGIQFQNPAFVAGLTVVVLLFMLNLWGLFEIPLPTPLARVAAAGPSEGLAGHLTTGFFATLMATPCSAPFLGTALGFALTRDAPTTFAMFAAIGTGMASPYLLLAAAPGLGRLIPKPGRWMHSFRIAMGFLLAGTAVWLLYVLSGLVALASLVAFVVLLISVSTLTWTASREKPFSSRRRGLMTAAGILGVASVAVAARPEDVAPARALGVAPEDRRIAWEAFDPRRAEREAATGRYVFVDVTADWCVTCKVNERLFLETEDVAAAFERHGVIAMQADWTRRDDAIAAYLASFGRYGIPFYVMYRPDAEPYVFSELLSRTAIVDLLEGPVDRP